jgi:hypothetical protein
MVAPIDYGVEVADPTKSFLSAFQAGASIRDAQRKQEQQTKEIEQQKLIQEGFNKLRSPDATAADYANLSMMLPEAQAKSVRESFNLLSGERQQTALQQSGQVFSAFKSGNPDIAINLLNQQIEAKRNSGDEPGAKFLQTWRDVAIENPKSAEDYFGFTISQIPGGDKVITSAIALSKEGREAGKGPSELSKSVADANKAVADAALAVQNAANAVATAPDNVAKAKAEAELVRAQADKAALDARFAERLKLGELEKQAADLGLTKAQTNSAIAQTRKLGQETSKIVIELAALKANNGLDPTKAFEQEEKLRKEFQVRSKVYGELGTTFSNIQSSATAQTGPGDIALITGFMKMLDPGSVVRETEFATARDTAGLYTRLENSLKKAESGQFLQPNQRSEFVNLAKQYLDSAQKKAGEDKKALGVVVKNYRLNPDNVFGPEQAAPSDIPPMINVIVGRTTYGFKTQADVDTFKNSPAYKKETGAK